MEKGEKKEKNERKNQNLDRERMKRKQTEGKMENI